MEDSNYNRVTDLARLLGVSHRTIEKHELHHKPLIVAVLHSDNEALAKYSSASILCAKERIRIVSGKGEKRQFYLAKTQLKLINEDIDNIRLISNPTFEVQRRAVLHNPTYIMYIGRPSISLQHFVVRLDPKNIEFINNPDREVIDFALESSDDIFELIPGEYLTWCDFWHSIMKWHKFLMP